MSDIRRAIIAVCAMFALNGALFGIWASRIPAFVARFSLSDGALGLLLLALAGGAILAFPVAGALSDRMGAARVTRIIAVLYVLAMVLLAMSPTLGFLAVSLVLFGMCHGGMDVAMNSWAAEVERAHGRPVMSIFHALFSLGAGLGALSGFLAVRADIAVLPHFTVMAVALGAISLWLAAVPWQSEIRPAAGGPIFVLPKGVLALVGLIAFSASLGEGAMADWSAVFLISEIGVSEARGALGYAVFSVTMVATRLSGGLIVGRLGPVATGRLSGVLALTGALVAVFATALTPALLGFALLGIGYASIMPLAFSRAAAETGIGAGRALASVATLGYGGMLLGPPLIGGIAQLTSLRVAFLLLAVLALAMIALARVLRRP